MNVPVWVDSKHKIAHNKVMIIDGNTTITGSFNFTSSAEDNAENMLIIDDQNITTIYEQNWQDHKLHSVKWGLK